MEYIYDNPSLSPQESEHWKALNHEEGDRLIETIQALQDMLLLDLESKLSLWSTLLGYCEALSTSKNIRYKIFPIPIDALQRLVKDEFTPPRCSDHRQAAHAISNWVWSKVLPKSNVKDEKHANSLYVVLTSIDRKSVDCFGAAVSTVIGLRDIGFDSTLVLSEDHAYECHTTDGTIETCEVAIPGNTKAQRKKRGQEIIKTFQNSQLTPNTSWLYMFQNAVYCRTPGMILGAILANVNALIDHNNNRWELYSEPLLILKRELLWILKNNGYLERIPFALCELGWSEEHMTSEGGEKRVSIELEDETADVTTMEALYHEAIKCNKQRYQDKQVYPYCYLGFFHKDGGQDEEYRLPLAMKYFSEAARVASGYRYESGHTLQLTKVMTKVSEFIVHEILCDNDIPRAWSTPVNAVTSCRWLISFYDYLLLWEERSGSESFLPICRSSHKTGISRAFAQLSSDIRIQSFGAQPTQSQRLTGSLRKALEAPKISISDMHLTIMTETKRRRKRKIEM